MTGGRRTRLWAICLLVAVAMLVCAASSFAAPTIVGEQTLTADEGLSTSTGQNIPVFQGAASGNYTLTSAQTGVITSWSFMSAGVEHGTPYVLRVLAPAGGSSWRAVATSKPVQVTSATGTDAMNGPFPDGIPIAAGDAIAIQPTNADGDTPIEQGVAGMDGIRYFSSPFEDGSTAELAPGSELDNGQVVPVQATVEPPEPAPSTLAITLYGEGTGEVSDDHGHTCFKTTAETTSCPLTSWSPGSVVNLQGTAAAGSTFDGFYGPGCLITTACSVTMNGNQTMGAFFHRPQEIGITLAGTGYGSVSAPGTKISCTKPAGSSGAFCPFYVPWNTAVTLHATPEPGSTFSGWSGGGCKGTAECFLDTVFGTQQTTATFSPAGEVHVNAIEVTQGIQTSELPTRTSSAGTHVSYHGVSMPWSAGAPVTVKLVEGHATVARVYANAESPLAAGSSPPMRLTAIRNGLTLAPGPIAPDKPPSAAALPVGALGVVGAAQRFSPSGAYTFTLPAAWTHGDISLQADANPDPNAFADGCADVACRNRGLILDGVNFNAVHTTTINPIAFVAGLHAPKGYPGPDPQWSKVESVLPVPLQVNPYVQVTSANGTLSGCAGLEQEKEEGNEEFAGKVYRQRAAELLQSAKEWELENYVRIGYPMGLASAEVANVCPNARGFTGGLTGGGASIATDDRAFNAMAHELSHGIGRTHAGVECGSGSDAAADEANGTAPDKEDDALNGGQSGETWPQLVGGTNFVGGTVKNTFIASNGVESDGALDGVGLLGMESLANSPYRIAYNSTLPNPTGEIYDLMSYCGNNSNTWTSVRNWNRDVEYAEGVPVDVTGPIAFYGSFYAREIPPANAHSARSLAVSLVYDTGSARPRAMNVAPDEGPATPSEPGGYTLTARDAAGHAIASAGAVAEPVHLDDAPLQLLIIGKVPATGTRSVEVLQNGSAIALDRASPSTPTASLVSPRSGARVGRAGTVAIRWLSHDADGGALKATIRYSADEGRTWRTVFSGADQGSAILPSRMLAASRRARIRLYVSDGFNEAIVTSARFISIGAPPQVSITDPGPGVRAAAGSAISLTGSAFDDAGAPLSGRSLTWRSGRQILGTGASTSTVALGAGRHVITLTARDRSGRSATASVSIRIVPTVPTLRLLHIPHRTSSKATRVTVVIATLAPATLTVAGRRVSLDRSPKSIRVPIRPGRKALTVALVLRSGPFTSRFTATVAR